MPLIDAHTHFNINEMKHVPELLEWNDVYALVAGMGTSSCARVERLAKLCKRVIPVYGLHPGRANQNLENMEEWLDKAVIIGEIGLDRVWSKVDFASQLKVYEYQLGIAAKRSKPVVLHTKGAEEESFQLLKKYEPPLAVVHWYTGGENELKSYIEFGCYFTIGPDVTYNTATQQVVRMIPEDRILTETDGVSAVAWARHRPCTLNEIPDVLRLELNEAAKLRKTDAYKLKKTVWENFKTLLKDANIHLI